MKIKARVRQVGYKEGKLLAVLECNEKAPRKDDIVTVKWGSTRTNAQNALYWVYLNWLINHGGLKEQGHFSAEALHIDLKTHFLAEKIMDKGQFREIEEPTTTILGKTEFSEYVTKVGDFCREFFEVDDSAFWQEQRQLGE